MADPILVLHNPEGSLFASNDNWRDTQDSVITTTELAPSNSLEPAIVATLVPGAYIAIVRGKDDSTGITLEEVSGLKPNR